MVRIYLSLVFLIMTVAAWSRDPEDGRSGSFIPEAYYTGDNVFNISGGIKRGYCYLGMARVSFAFDAGRAKLWRGGLFYANAVATHGSAPSEILLGDMQVASNIEAGNHVYLQELWFKQVFGKTEMTVGLQDLNSEFANSEHSALFLNSSFGIVPVISGNISAPIFPLTTLGITLKWNLSERTTWLNAIYDGSPTNFDYNPYNVKWGFMSGDGLLAITELQHQVDTKGLGGTYKAGLYSHSHFVEERLRSSFPDSLSHCVSGVYIYADQKVWEKEGESLCLFVQSGYSPSETTIFSSYVGFGLCASGFLSRTNSDQLGLAVAHAGFSESAGSETVFELTWQKQISKNIFFQPNIQYILSPSGQSSSLSNCLAAIMRIGISL